MRHLMSHKSRMSFTIALLGLLQGRAMADDIDHFVDWRNRLTERSCLGKDTRETLCLDEPLLVGQSSSWRPENHVTLTGTSSDETLLRLEITNPPGIIIACLRRGVARLVVTANTGDGSPRSWSQDIRCWEVASIEGPTTIDLEVGEERFVKYVARDPDGHVVPYQFYHSGCTGKVATDPVVNVDDSGVTVLFEGVQAGQESCSFMCGNKKVAVTLRVKDVARSAEWEKGLADYRRKKYTKACESFALAAKQEPKNGAIWADLGLCEYHRGRYQASIDASQMAVRYGNRMARRNAYFNLYQAFNKVQAFIGPDEVPARSVLGGCTQRIEVAEYRGNGYGVILCRGECTSPGVLQRELQLSAQTSYCCMDDGGNGMMTLFQCVIVSADGCAVGGRGAVGYACVKGTFSGKSISGNDVVVEELRF